MPEIKAFLIENSPTAQQLAGIQDARRKAWERNGRDYYPYHAFSDPVSWSPTGELGREIVNGRLHIAVAVDDANNIQAHVAGQAGKYGWEFGRVFSTVEGQGYGVAATTRFREFAESHGINEVHMGVSYNRTAMFRTFEKGFLQDTRRASVTQWHAAVLGLLPDIYTEHDMQWGEIMVRAVHGENARMELPALTPNIPEKLQAFAKGMQKLNGHALAFSESAQEATEARDPYKFNKNNANLLGIAWEDGATQERLLADGYTPVGIVKLEDRWHFVMHKGHLPLPVPGIANDLESGRNNVHYPKHFGPVNMEDVMTLIYRQ